MCVICTTPVADRVALGVAFLDSREGHEQWRSLIDRPTLVVADSRRCVLAQLYRAETGADPSLWSDVREHFGLSSTDASRYGFDGSVLEDSWQAAWERAIWGDGS